MKKSLLSICIILPLMVSSCGKSTTKSISAKSNNSKNSIEIVKKTDGTKTTTGTTTKPSENTKELAPPQADPNINVKNLSTKEIDWYYIPKEDGTPSGQTDATKNLIKKYSGYYLGDTSKKIIYLTFDEGYECGNTGKILDTLKSNNVKAAFFVTTPYLKSDKDLAKRMVNEGQLVCNHTTTHPSLATITDKTKFQLELTTVDETLQQITGTKINHFLRPPMGKYSEESLYYTQSLGYRTIFWSFAYVDWDPKKQPDEEYAKKLIMKRTHNGGIFLLHAESKTNADILDYLIKQWKSQGYEFKTLNDLPQ